MDTFPLNISSLLQDPRYLAGKELLAAVIQEAQTKLTTVAPPKKQLVQQYRQFITQIDHLRGNPLYYPYLGTGLGNGLFVELADGSVKYDLIGGIGTHFFGHSHPGIISAAIDGAIQNSVMQGNLQQNYDSLQLMELLCKTAKMDHLFLSTSGAMACENGLKIIFQKKHPAFRVIAFEGCFMGRTLAMSQITDKPGFRVGLPATLFVDYIPFYDPQHPQESTKAALCALYQHLTRHPGEYAALIFEPIQGERGFYVGSTPFFKAVIQLAKKHNLAIMADEVQTFARTEALFATQYFGIEEDIDVMTIAKVLQLGATLWKKEYTPQPGLLSQTFTANTSSIHVALFILHSLLQGDLYGPNGKIHALYHHFVKRLKKLEPYVQGPYGAGSMIAFTPFDGTHAKATALTQQLFHNGVISFIAGSNPTRIRFLLPAAIMNLDDIDRIMDIVETTIRENL